MASELLDQLHWILKITAARGLGPHRTCSFPGEHTAEALFRKKDRTR